MKNTIITHRGLFHADEVFACAILKKAGFEGEIKRVSVEEAETWKVKDAFIIDTGREYSPEKGMFDHHQINWRDPQPDLIRDNGIPYASAGLVWQEFGEWIAGSNADRVEKILIEGIDANDAGGDYFVQATCAGNEVRTMTISSIISSFNTNDVQDDKAQMEAFFQAVDFAEMILKNTIKSAAKFVDAIEKFEEIATIDGPIIELSEFVPWKEVVHDNYPEAQFIVSPGTQSPYQLLAVPVHPAKRELKQPIERSEWFKGFIHAGKFIAGCESAKEARKLAEFNIKKQKQNHV